MLYTSYSEYLKLPEFRAVCQRIRQRSGGICECCKVAKATEPHHVVYCKWGEIDSEHNLLDVCHKCHCKLHTCEQCGQVKLKAKQIKLGKKVCFDCERLH